MHAENLFTAFDVGVRHLNLTVKAARAQKRGVENVGAVGRGNDDDAFVGLKAVHLDEKLVQRLLALVVAAAIADATRTAHGVDLVDEDDARRILFRLFKHIANAARAYTDEHFNEVGARDREERHTSLARNGAGQKRLTGARRADKKGALGDLTAKTREFLRVAKELDDFLKLFLGLVDARDIVKRYAAMLFGQEFGAALAETHSAAFAAALHPVHKIDPHADQQKEGQKADKEGLQTRLFLRLGLDRDVLFNEKRCHFGIAGQDRHIVFAVCPAEHGALSVERDRRHSAIFNSGDEVGIAPALALHRARAAAEDVEQRQNQQKQHDPENDIARVTQRELLLFLWRSRCYAVPLK